ncbi:MAG: sigma-70 family RNA polymerase sigma factor [Planctomycetota bacterium]
MRDDRGRKAFEILIRQNSRMLNAYIGSVVEEQSLADDLYQETMVVAWKKLDECDLTRPFGPWLRGIASRLLLAHYRKAKSNPVVLDDSIIQQVEHQFDAIDSKEADRWEDKVALLRECLEALPEKSRLAIQGRYFDGLKAPPLAKRLGITVEACWKRLARSRGLIAECLQRKGVTVDPEAAS